MKEYFTLQVKDQMKIQKVRKYQLAEKVGCTRPTLDRVLDKDDTSVRIGTLIKVANALGKSLSIRLVDKLEVKSDNNTDC